MKKLFQLNFLLLLVSSATAQESSPQELAPQQPTKILRVYDWNDLAQQHQLAGGEVISMDGNAVLKIENTNDAPPEGTYYINGTPLEVSLLKITDSVVKRTCWVSCELKFESVWAGLVQHTNHVVNGEAGVLKLLTYTPPSAPGGDERINTSHFDLRGTSNWKLYKFVVDRTEPEGLPTHLELKLSLPGHGTIYLRSIRLLGGTGSWWSAKQSGTVGGAVGIFGGIIGCVGGLLGCLAGFGKARKFVLATTKIFIALGMLLTITGIVAIVCQQPFFVWYVFLLPGVVLTLIFSLNFPMIQRRYDDLEIRRIASIDVMGS
jgi:hypothetical protein